MTFSFSLFPSLALILSLSIAFSFALLLSRFLPLPRSHSLTLSRSLSHCLSPSLSSFPPSLPFSFPPSLPLSPFFPVFQATRLACIYAPWHIHMSEWVSESPRLSEMNVPVSWHTQACVMAHMWMSAMTHAHSWVSEWVTPTCDIFEWVTHPHVCHDACLCVPWHSHIHEWHRRIRACDMLFVRVTCRLRTWDMPFSQECLVTHMGETFLVVTHAVLHDMPCLQQWFTGTSHPYVWQPYSHVWHDSFMCNCLIAYTSSWLSLPPPPLSLVLPFSLSHSRTYTHTLSPSLSLLHTHTRTQNEYVFTHT